MTRDIPRLKELLLQGNYITQLDANRAEEYCKTHDGSLTSYLLDQGLITIDLLGQAVAESLHLSYTNLPALNLSSDQIHIIPESVAKTYRVVLCSATDTECTVTTDSPGNESLIPAVSQLFPHKQLRVTYSLPTQIDALFVHYQKPLETRFSQIIQTKGPKASALLEEIFEDALMMRTSDIHFEPYATEVAIRFRVMGSCMKQGGFQKITMTRW